jgi:hypothetical protein
MNLKEAIDDFVAQRSLALVGISRHEKKFGNMVLREMKSFHRAHLFFARLFGLLYRESAWPQR